MRPVEAQGHAVGKRGHVAAGAPVPRGRPRSRLSSVLAKAAARLGPAELRRRFWHMLPGFLPFLLWPVPHADPISPTLRAIIFAILAGFALAIVVQYRRIARRADNGRISCVMGYCGSIFAAIVLFPSAAEIGLTVLAILAFGDGSATLGGKLFAGRTLPWNREKTWSGLLSFIFVGAPMAAVIYWGESHNLEAVDPGVSFTTAFLCCSVAVLLSAVAESLRSRVNDNVRVGLVATAALAVMHGVCVGW